MNSSALTTNALCEIGGVDRNLVHRWVRGGFLEPANLAAGTGHYREWSAVQATAVTYAASAALSERDGPEAKTEGYAALLAHFIARHTPEQLEAAFARGRTLVVLVGGGETFRLVPPPPGAALPAHLDLERTYRGVLRRIATLAV